MYKYLDTIWCIEMYMAFQYLAIPQQGFKTEFHENLKI